MGDAAPPLSIESWLKSSGVGKTLPAALAQSHDIYVFGTQVCEGYYEWSVQHVHVHVAVHIKYESYACS